MAILHKIVVQCHRTSADGCTILFAGPPGISKTIAARVLATELELDLYRVELAAVVGKYIGETEKNLHRLFEAAEASDAVLLFDEADALFGKRSEVKDSHDRSANLETNYLMQRLEKYPSLVIVTTNREGNLDAAFARRLQFVVEFPLPNTEKRRSMWKTTRHRRKRNEEPKHD